MARRSTRIQELREKDELSCMWGLFSILESCQGRPGRKLISNGRRVNHHVIDYPRKLDRLASFDKECRKIQSEAGLRRVAVDARAKRVGNFIQEEMSIEKHKSKENIVVKWEYAKMDSELDRIVKSQNRARKSSEKVHHLSSFRLNKAASAIHRPPAASAELSLNKLTLAAVLEAVYAKNQKEENKHSERSSSEPKSFSDALEVLSSNKNLHLSRTDKETVESVLDCDFSECEGLDACSTAETLSALITQKGNINKKLWRKSDKIVILKPAPRNAKQSENVLCNCSSLQRHRRLGRTSSFSFREMKKKLKHTLGVSDKNSQERSALGVGDECIYGSVEIRNSFDSSKSCRVSDIASWNNSARKKLDFSSVGFSNRWDFDVIMEAKKHLSARLKNRNSVEAVTSKRSPKTLGQILSSPEHDFLPLIPRKDSQYCSGSAQMRFSPYSTSPRATEYSSQMPSVRERTCLIPFRSNTEVTSCDDHYKCDCTLQKMHAKTCSLIPSTEKEALDTRISTQDNIKSNGDSKILEMNSILQQESHVSEEVTSEIKNAGIKSQKDDEIIIHSISDSLSENETITSTVDDFPSTPLSIYPLDTTNNIKYQQEHRSPVSVLEPYFIEDANSPPSIMFQTAKKQLQPRCLHFEECSFEPIHQDLSISTVEEEDHLSQYVQLLLQVSCLNWDKLSEIRCLPEELLHSSLFDEVEFPPLDCYYDPKLLFDHINEILLEICKDQVCYPPWPALAKLKIESVSLAELVVDEIMREAEFCLLPWNERITLDQLVWNDVVKCRSWLDVRLDTEHVAIEISEDFLEESMLDIVLEFCT